MNRPGKKCKRRQIFALIFARFQTIMARKFALIFCIYHFNYKAQISEIIENTFYRLTYKLVTKTTTKILVDPDRGSDRYVAYE